MRTFELTLQKRDVQYGIQHCGSRSLRKFTPSYPFTLCWKTSFLLSSWPSDNSNFRKSSFSMLWQVVPNRSLINLLCLQFPSRDIHKQLQKWAAEYGPIYSLMMGTQVLIVLSSDVVVKDLMDKRSAIYSSRPDAYIGDIASGYLRVGLMVSSSK